MEQMSSGMCQKLLAGQSKEAETIATDAMGHAGDACWRSCAGTIPRTNGASPAVYILTYLGREYSDGECFELIIIG